MDVAFGTDGWRAAGEEFTMARVRAVGQAVVDYLHAEEETAPVAVGYDPRASSRPAAEELCRVLCAGGFDVRLAERDTPTPVVAWAVVDRGLSGALQVTASHNPPEYNGVKFIPSDGAPALPAVTDRLAANLRRPDPTQADSHGTVREVDFVADYLSHATTFVAEHVGGADSLADREIAYDAMHGSGRGVTDRLLEEAGAAVSVWRGETDREFGGTPPEPTGERLGGLVAAVTDGDASLGIANDGDADRIGVVTPARGYVDPNLLYAALYEVLLETDGGPAVRTVSTTFLIDRIAEAHDESVVETPVGFKWVAEAMADHDALVGGEESGGFGITGHLRNKDGVLIALVVAMADAVEPLDDRLDRIRERYGDIVADRVSVACPDDRKAEALAALEEAIPDEVAGAAVESVGTADGFKLQLADGSWLLVRPSGTEPKLRVYAEADSDKRVKALLAEGEQLVAAVLDE